VNRKFIVSGLAAGALALSGLAAILPTAGKGWDGPTGLGTPNGTGAF
jgi:hypothetical protein